MRMRKGAPLLFALTALLGSVGAASASHIGAFRFSSVSNACCDAQNCYSSCQQQNRVTYKLVYENVEEKRWRTCYQTVCETVNKQVQKTCYRTETQYKDCNVTKFKMVAEECTRMVPRTCWKEVQCCVHRPQIECCVKQVECCVRRCVPKHCEKECHYTVCRPVYEQHCHVHCGQVKKQICEVHCKEVCRRVCCPVTECCHKEVCCQVSRCIEECHVKQVCVPSCRDVVETCYKECTRRISEPCTTYKTVTRRVIECVDEPCAPIGGRLRGVFSGIGLGRNNCCEPARNACADQCFDPCAGKTIHLFDRIRNRGCNDACNTSSCNTSSCNTSCANDCRPAPTRKVWRVRCVTEQVPCTTHVTRCVTEKVPYTVCKKVRYHEVKNVSYMVRRNVRGAYVDDKGCGHECDGPGRHFKEGAVARKQVPYHVTKMVTHIEKKSIPYTVSRCVTGAYFDCGADGKHHGDGHACDGPGRKFVEGASFKVAKTYTTCRMVRENCVKKVPYVVHETVIEKQIKQIPYQVCRMVPCTVTKKVPYQECVAEKYTVCRKVPYTECVKVPYCCKVPYTVCETVPCQVTKKVKVCVPETVCVRKARMVACDPGCGNNNCGGNDNCCRTGFLGRLRQRGFASLCSTGCCEKAPSTCNDKCHDYCRESLMNRIFRNRFACDACCDSATTVPSTTTEKVAPPKKLPN